MSNCVIYKNETISKEELGNKLYEEANIINNDSLKSAFDSFNNIIYLLSKDSEYLEAAIPHQLALYWANILEDNEKEQIIDWFNENAEDENKVSSFTTEVAVQFATGFESFLANENKKSSKKMEGFFQKFAEWFKSLTDNIKERLGIELNDNINNIYYSILNSKNISQNKKDIVEENNKGLKIEKQIEVTEKADNIKTLEEGKQIFHTTELLSKDISTIENKKGVYSVTYNDKSIGEFKIVEEDGLYFLYSSSIDKEEYSSKEEAEQAGEDLILDEYNSNISEQKSKESFNKYFNDAFLHEDNTKKNFLIKLFNILGIKDIENKTKSELFKELYEKINEKRDVSEKTKNDYNYYAEFKIDGNKRYYKQIDDYGAIIEFEDNYGHRITLPKSSVKYVNITEQEFSSQKELEVKKSEYSEGDTISYSKQNLQEPQTGVIVKVSMVLEDVRKNNTKEEGVKIPKQKNSNRSKKQVYIYTLEDGSEVKETNVNSKILTKETIEENINEEHFDKIELINNIIDKFKILFGEQIKIKINEISFKEGEFAKFYNGEIHLNINKLVKQGNIAEIIGHEFMHPFVEALSLSNKELFDNLADEALLNEDVKKHLRDGGYGENRKEAIVKYLGLELSKAFDENGQLIHNVIIDKTKNAFRQFLSWLVDFINLLVYRNKIVNNQKVNLSELTNIKVLKESIFSDNIVMKTNDTDIEFLLNGKIVKSVKINEETKEFIDEEGNIYKTKNAIKNEILKEYNSDEDSSFNINITISKNQNNSIEINEENGIVNIQLDSSLENLSYNELIPILRNFILRSNIENKTTIANILSNEIINKTLSKSTRKNKIEIKGLNPLLTLNDVSNLLLFNLAANDNVYTNTLNKEVETDKNNIPVNISSYKESIFTHRLFGKLKNSSKTAIIKYNKEELEAFKNVEEFYKISKDATNGLKRKLEDKVKKLEEMKRRFPNNILIKKDYSNFKYLLESGLDDVAFTKEFLELSSGSISVLYSMYLDMVDTYKNARNIYEIGQASTEFKIISELLGFHSEFESLTDSYNFDLKLEKEDYTAYKKSVELMKRIKNKMEDHAISLVTKRLEPRIKMWNTSIKEKGYGDEYLLDEALIKSYFKYGVGEDTGFITYWLSANIENSDPINGLISNMISDSLSIVNMEVNEIGQDIGVAFNSFIKDNNLSLNQKTEYYKKHFLRKAIINVWSNEKGEYEEVEKWALHQPFLWDIFARDLEIFKKSLPSPKNIDEEIKNNEAIEKWKVQRGYSNIKGVERLTDTSYINTSFTAAYANPLFKILYDNYNESNKKYGINSLKYGILPQEVEKNFIQKLSETHKDLKDAKKAEVLLTAVQLKIKKALNKYNDIRQTINMDGTIGMNLKANLTKIQHEDDAISLNLESTISDFVREAYQLGNLRNDANTVEIIKMLLEGNSTIGIEGRKLAKRTSSQYTSNPKNYLNAVAELKILKNKKKEDPSSVTDDELRIAKEKVDSFKTKFGRVYDSITGKNSFKGFIRDKVTGNIIPSEKERLNDMLIKQINSVYFHAPDEDFVVSNISGKKIIDNLGFYTSAVNLGFNLLAATSNINIGNAQMLIESFGGKHYTKKHLAKAFADYIKNIPSYLADTQRPIKTKDSQLAIMLDAIQGEISDEFGNRYTGNLAKKLLSMNSLFLFNNVAEHQIQMTNMKAMMLAKKIKTKSGEEISLYDAYVEDSNGRYKLRTDVIFSEQDLLKFISLLHGVNRDLNGNYSELNKNMLQHKWYGSALLKFKKYLYPAFRARFNGEQVNFEKNDIEVGYIRYYIGTHLISSLKKIAKAENPLNLKELKPHQIYAIKKARAELGMFLLLTLSVMMFAGGGGDDDKDKKEFSVFEKFVLLQMLRLRSDIGMYSIMLPETIKQQWQNPSANMRTVSYMYDLVKQLYKDPSETYKASQGGHEKGDSKLAYKVWRLVPLHQIIDIVGKNEMGTYVDRQLSYMTLVNKNIKGIKAQEN